MRFRTPRFFKIIVFILFIGLPFFNSVVAEPLNIIGADVAKSLTATQYGPTGSYDTLWGIAQKVRPDNRISIYQVMAALFQSNPHAFNNKNYNSLEKGMILAIPSVDEMRQIPLSKARDLALNNDPSRKKIMQQPPSQKTKLSKTPITKVKSSVKPKLAAEPQAIVEPANQQSKVEVKSAIEPFKVNELQQNISQLTEQIEDLQNKNLALTDELARALDQLAAMNADNKNLKVKILELTELLTQAEQSLQINLKNNQGLKEDIKFLEMETQELKTLQSLKPSFFVNPWVIGAIGLMGSSSILGLGYWLVSRKTKKADNTKESTSTKSDNNDLNDDSEEAVITADDENASDNQGEQSSEQHDEVALDQTNENTDENIIDPSLSLESLWDETSTDFVDDLKNDDESAEQHSDSLVSGDDSLTSIIDPDSHDSDSSAENNVKPVKPLDIDDLLEPSAYSGLLDEDSPKDLSVTQQKNADETQAGTDISSEPSSSTSVVEKDESLGQNDIDDLLNASIEFDSAAPNNSQESEAAEPSYTEGASDDNPEQSLDQNSIDDLLNSGIDFEPSVTDDTEILDSTETSSSEIDPTEITHDETEIDAEDKLDSVDSKAEQSLDQNGIDDLMDLTDVSENNLNLNETAADNHEEPSNNHQQTKSSSFDESDLANFQGEEGFIDIDLLLSEAEEADEGEDNYVQPEPHLEKIDKNTMVDVDDEENSISAKLDLARAYIEIEDYSNARVLLDTVLLDGNPKHQQEAKKLLDFLGDQPNT